MSYQKRYGHLYTWKFSLPLTLFSLAAVLVSCSSAATSNMMTTSNTFGLVANNHGFVQFDLGLPEAAFSTPSIGNVDKNQQQNVDVTFKINPQTYAALTRGYKVQAGLTSSTAAKLIGVSDQVYQQVHTAFGVNGAQLKWGALRTNVTISAPSSTIANIFHTSFVIHQSGVRTYYVPAASQPPMLPKTIAASIEAVTGLDSYSQTPVYHSALATQSSASASASLYTDQRSCINGRNDLLLPSRVAHAYGYDQFWKQGVQGQGTTVNIVGFGGYNSDDVQNYFACFGYQGKLTENAVDMPLSSTSGETTLDIEAIAGMAPASNIAVYVADLQHKATFDDYATLYSDLLQQVINNNVDSKSGQNVVNLSWGQPEGYITSNYMAAVNQRIWILTYVEHMTVLTSSGDCGAFDAEESHQLAVDFPASSPWSVSVGGTMLTLDQQAERAHEVVWSSGTHTSTCHNQWGSGGGISTEFKQPRWQQSSKSDAAAQTTQMRQLPDVAAVADNLPLFYGGQWHLVSGTSVAAPIWAAGLVLLNQATQKEADVVYYGPAFLYMTANAGQSSFYDVISGNNLHYAATPGRDNASGLGTPNLFILNTNLGA